MSPETTTADFHEQDAVVDGEAPVTVDGPPRWFELLVVGGASLVATTGLVGLVLAFLGAYRTWAALAVGVPIAAVMVIVTARSRPASRSGSGATREAAIGAGAAIVVAVLFAVVAGRAPSQHVLLDRDPSSYQSTALILSNEGSLDLDAATGGLEAAPEGVLRFEGPAVYEVDDGELEMQFNHLTSVVLAVAYDVGGARLMLRVPALLAALGLLAVYAVAVQALRRPILALLPPVLLAVGVPLLYVSRDTYSEPVTLVLLWAAIAVLVQALARPSAALGAVGGVLLGATVAARADALLFVVLFFPLAALGASVAVDRAGRVRAAAAATAGLLVTLPIGFVDLSSHSGGYVTDVGDEVAMMRTAAIASCVASALLVALVFRDAFGVRRLLRPWPVAASTLAGVVVVVVLLGGWWVRPWLQEAHSAADYGIDAIQRRDGLEIDPRRNYAEDSLVWMSWYLGAPALLAAIGGCGVGVARFLRHRTPAALAPVLALGLGVGLLYWWDPIITPDQPWASRRFITGILPALAVLAALGVGVVLDRMGRPAVRWTVACAAAVLLVVPPALTTWPVRDLAFQRGYADVLVEACGLVGEDGTVLVAGAYEQLVLQQALRGWCDVPVAGMGDLTGEQMADIARAAEAQGRVLRVVAADSERLVSLGFPGTVSPVASTRPAWDRRSLERTLDRPPDDYLAPRDAVSEHVDAPFALHVVTLGAPKGTA